MEVIAIDVHVHLCDERTLEARGERAKQMARYFGRERKPVSVDEMADQYRARKMMAAMAGRMGMPGSRKPQRAKKGKKGAETAEEKEERDVQLAREVWSNACDRVV